MQLKFIKSVVEAQPQLHRVAGLAWSPNNQKLAVATADRLILLFDENGERRDKFSTKPSDPSNGKTSYVIRGLSFSPDSSRLAVAQSDHIVYVYRLGESWNDKKVICNKFPQTSVVMSMIWLTGGLIIAGLEDGKVRALHCKNNKSQTLYGTESMTIALSSNSRGSGFLSGHEDGSVIRFYIVEEPGEPSGKLFQHTTAPYALAWLQTGILAAGCDKKIHFYDYQGRLARVFDYSRDDNEREFMTATCSPNGQSVLIGSYDRIRMFTWSPRQNTWSETVNKEIKHLYSVTTIAWRRDGSKVAVGSVSGAVLMFESVLRRTIWQDKFEITFVAPSQVLMKSLQDNAGVPFLIESQLGLEIDDVRVMGKDSYLVGRTEETLILCDLNRNLTSEVPWIATGRHERFYFENPNVCLIFNAGELSLVEYGFNYISGSVRSEFVNPHVISVRLNERGNSKNNKKLAYLLDMKTICVMDLISQATIAQITHDSKIDWIELSETAHKLLFRDKKMRLILVDISTSKKQTLLGKASFVQWVFGSDVAVAQSDSNLAVWYNIDLPEHVTIMTVRGDVVDVIREDGRTEVHTREGPAEHIYQLDEGLVEFGTAVNDCDFGRAVLYLESLGDKPAAKAMWHNLANIALIQQNLRVAQRCFAALGNASKTFYISETIKIAEKFEETAGSGTGMTCPEVRARMALLCGDLRTAERIYVEQGDIESALKMYIDLRRWDDAIKLADRRGYHGVQDLRDKQMSYLLNSGQEEKAGDVLEDRGEKEKAMSLFLKAIRPAKAARLALKTPSLIQNEELMARVTAALIKSEIYELAGDLAQKVSQPENAVALYRKGGAYARAIELARQISPDEVTNLEEEWGDWLVSKRQLDASISHYIEAAATTKAFEAAVGAKQWRKAVQIAKVLDEPEEIRKHAPDLADHLSQIGDLNTAEDILLRAELYREAITLLNKHGQWEKAFDIAEKFITNTDDIRDMFIDIAKNMETKSKFRDAEKIYITIGEPDQAIQMYKNLEMFDSMIRLIERYHKDLVESTHMNLARQLEGKGKYKNAEVHYIAANDWKSAVHMYCLAGKWEDAYRIARQKGGDDASNQVVFMWARSLPLEAAARLLTKMGQLDNTINFACEAGQFEFALDICRITEKPADEVHLKIAIALEDEGKFNEAEAEFLLANKPKEAIMMHTHSGDWKAAIRIAEKYAPETVNEILLSQANAALESRNYPEYEALLIRAERPELIIQHYRDYGMWSDALRIAREYVPGAISELQRLQTKSTRGSANDSRYLLQQASDYARNEEFKKAVDCLLQINSSNSDESTIERAILRAAEICNQFLEGQDAIEIAHELGPRLMQINQIGPAAQLYLAAELPQEAVDVFIRTENWNKARRLAKEISPGLVNYVEQQQKSRLRNEGNIEQLADIDIMSALDMLAEEGQWTRCVDKAKQHSGAVLQKYLALYATQLIRDRDCISALKLYLVHGSPALQQNYNIYNRIAVECFALRDPEGESIWKELRNFLFQVVSSIKNSEANNTEALDRFEQLLLISHYYSTRAICRKNPALQTLGIKISLALLRYTDIIPVDKGFYEAGMDLRNVNRESEAFVVLNHYLDVCGAIEEGTGNLVDHSDLLATDFPSSVPIPPELHLKNEEKLHEEAREWVLAVSMDQKIDQQLPIDDRNLYESSLGLSDMPCVVSGYPVVGRQPVLFQRSHRLANRDSWSKLTVAAKMSPQSDISDVIQFIEKWCGPANFISM